MAEVPHILSSRQFGADNLGAIFERAAHFKRMTTPEKRRMMASRYVGYKLVTLFYEPSTRTRLSFESAAAGLGMGVVSTENAAEFSSAVKGETIEDTIKVVGGYGDVIVIRGEENAAARAAAVSDKPIINAGDGGHEHPTQAVLDVFSIHEDQGALNHLNIAFGGDLRFGRTIRSLVEILSRAFEGNQFVFIAPEEIQLSDDIRQMLDERGASYKVTDRRDDGLRGADVVYWTRIQEERIKDPQDKSAVTKAVASGEYTLDKNSLRYMSKTATILHPLPRKGEITTTVDKDPKAKYFDQARNGVPVRQALLERILRNVHEQAT